MTSSSAPAGRLSATVGDATPTATRSADHRSPWLPVLWTGFAILLFFVVLVGGSWLGLYVGWVRQLDLAIVAIALIVWLLVAWRHPRARPATAIWPAFGAALLAMALSLLASRAPRLGLDYLAWAVLLVALYLLLVRIVSVPYVRARLGGLLALVAFVLASVYIVWTLALWSEWWSLVGELRMPPFRPTHLGLTFGSPSVLVGVQLLLVAAAAGGLGVSSRGARLTIAVLVGLTAFMVLISGSRSSWLALLGASVIVLVMAIVASRPSQRRRVVEAARTRAGTVLIVAAVVLAAGLAVAVGPAMLDHLIGTGDGGRPVYWVSALRMLADAPLLGQGPGTWMVRRVAYTQPGELDAYQPHAHGQYLQTGAELGLLGITAGIAAFACVAWLLVRAVRGTDPVRRRWAWASAFGLAYLALDVVVDVHTIPAVALLMAIPIAVLDATSDGPISLPRRLHRVAPMLRTLAMLLFAAGCAIAVVVLARSEMVASTNQRAVDALDARDWATALPLAQDAAAAEPDVGTYQLAVGLAALGADDPETAEHAFQAGTRIDDLPASWLGLAVAQADLGRPADEVADSLAEAMRLGRQQAAVTFAVAQVYDRIGRGDEADDAYAETLALAPSLAADEAWRASVGPERRARIIDGAIDASPGQAWELALMDGDADRARALAGDDDLRGFREDVIAAWTGDQAARDAVDAAADADAMDAMKLGWAARLNHRFGDDASTARYQRLIQLRAFYLPAIDVRTAPDPDTRTDDLGMSTLRYGDYLYRRVSPLDIMPPGLRGLVAAPPGEASP